MLDEFFKNLKKKSKLEKSKEVSFNEINNNSKFYNSTENNTNNLNNNNRQNSKSKIKEKEVDVEKDFLDEFNKFSDNQKSEEILKKYCTLYADEEMELEKTFSNKPNNLKLQKKIEENNFGNFGIKPLNHEYQQRKIRREQNLKTTGPDWFNMQAPEITPEIKEDLKALQLKNIIDPSRFYKKSDAKKLPKFFQVGRILDNITDGKKYRLRKSEVKNRIAEEILEADLAKNYSLRKFEELQGKRRKLGLKKMKINKYKMKNKKFSGRKDFVFK